MVLTGQGYEPCAGNSRGKLATGLKWLNLVIALVHHERGRADFRKQFADIQVSSRLKIAIGALGRSRLTLPLGKFLELFLRRARHEQRREQLTEYRGLLTPSGAD